MRLPNDQKFTGWELWGPFDKRAKLLKRHKEMYPVSRLRLYFVASYVLFVVFAFLFAYSATLKK